MNQIFSKFEIMNPKLDMKLNQRNESFKES